jgi:hypothetical protein
LFLAGETLRAARAEKAVAEASARMLAVLAQAGQWRERAEEQDVLVRRWQNEADDLQNRVAELTARLHAIEASTTWRFSSRLALFLHRLKSIATLDCWCTVRSYLRR